MDVVLDSIPWHCGFKDGCEDGWHLATYWATEDGYTVDEFSDGDYEDCEKCALPTQEKIDAAWAEYAADCLQTGKDPLRQYSVSPVRRVSARWQALFRESILGLVCVGVRRRGRGPWLSPVQASPEVRAFLEVEKTPGGQVWVFPNEDRTTSQTRDYLRKLAYEDPDLQLQQVNRDGQSSVKFLFTVEERRSRSPRAYQRELRACIREQMAG